MRSPRGRPGRPGVGEEYQCQQLVLATSSLSSASASASSTTTTTTTKTAAATAGARIIGLDDIGVERFM